LAYKEFEVTKLYYSIGEVAEMFSVSTSLLRFWESEFDILKPKKNRQGNRLFTDEDIKNLKVIHHLLKERGFTLEGAKKKLKENRAVTQQNTEVIESLKKLRAFLVEVKDGLGETADEQVLEQPTVAEQPLFEEVQTAGVEQTPVAEVEQAPANHTEPEQSAKKFLELPFDFSGFPSRADHE